LEDVSQVQNSDVPLFVEIFAGRGSLSFAQAGFSVLSIDHDGSESGGAYDYIGFNNLFRAGDPMGHTAVSKPIGDPLGFTMRYS
jgi:hypothetical protein